MENPLRCVSIGGDLCILCTFAGCATLRERGGVSRAKNHPAGSCCAVVCGSAADGNGFGSSQIDPVEERLAAMPLQEKVGQLFVVRVEALDPSGQSDSTRLTWAERQGLKKYPVGGIVVFRQNVKSRSS